MRIIPAIDIIDGKCVRLSEGAFDTSKVYYADPLEAALEFEAAGLEYLHLVDLDGARQRSVKNWTVLERLAVRTGLKIDFSGGISSREDVVRALAAGAGQVSVGSLAVRERATVEGWLQEFGADRVIIGADVRDGRIATHGWQETSDVEIGAFIDHYLQAGAVHFLCTEISRDGMLAGPAVELYGKLLVRFPAIRLIASGGVASLKDVRELQAAGCAAVIIGKAIYEGKIALEDLAALDATQRN